MVKWIRIAKLGGVIREEEKGKTEQKNGFFGRRFEVERKNEYERGRLLREKGSISYAEELERNLRERYEKRIDFLGFLFFFSCFHRVIIIASLWFPGN